MLFSYHVGCAKAEQYGHAAAERSISIFCSTMARQIGINISHTTVTVEAGSRFGSAALKQATIVCVCKTRQAEAENDCDCQN